MKTRIPIYLLGFTLLFTLVSIRSIQAQDICLKIGANYFINCKSVLTIRGHPVLQMTGDDNTGRKVMFAIYASNGKLDATLADGKFSGTHAKHFQIQQDPNGFTIFDDRDKRMILKCEGHYNESKKRKESHIWAQLYLPDGSMFQCTPETSNVPMLEMMKGSTFSNSGSAITID
jgi:hypothetical protein